MMKRDKGGRREETHVLGPCSTPISIGVKHRRLPPSTVPTPSDRNEAGEMLNVTFEWRRGKIGGVCAGKARRGAGLPVM